MCLLLAVMRLFLVGMQIKHPVIMESVTLPCLRILQSLIRPECQGGATAAGGHIAALVKQKVLSNTKYLPNL